MTKRKKPSGGTAKDLLDELYADPTWRGEIELEEAGIAADEAESDAASAPVREDLRSVGVDVDSLWDLVNASKPYPTAAVSVLTRHLTRSYPDDVTESIARALAVPEALSYWQTLKTAYLNTPADQRPLSKEGIAIALSAYPDESKFPELARLIEDERHGDSRVYLLHPLEESEAPQARVMLKRLSSNPALTGEVRYRLAHNLKD